LGNVKERKNLTDLENGYVFKTDQKEMGYETVHWIDLTGGGLCEHGNGTLGCMKCGECLD
jgi:hypothetical protein